MDLKYLTVLNAERMRRHIYNYFPHCVCNHFFFYLFVSHHEIMPHTSIQILITVTITLFGRDAMTEDRNQDSLYEFQRNTEFLLMTQVKRQLNNMTWSVQLPSFHRIRCGFVLLFLLFLLQISLQFFSFQFDSWFHLDTREIIIRVNIYHTWRLICYWHQIN